VFVLAVSVVDEVVDSVPVVADVVLEFSVGGVVFVPESIG
jgi:hypothetical protein